MPRLEKSVSAAIAAAVVAVAATVTSLASSPAPDDAPSAASAGATSSAPAASTPAGSAGASGDVASSGGRGRPASEPRAVLFLGRSVELNPRGGVAKSFACRAAVSLGWSCQVRQGATPVLPASAAADVVVVALVAGDDAARVTRLLDRLPAGAAGARLVFLGPTARDGGTSAGSVAARRSAGIRRLAAARGATFVDPAGAGWFADRDGAGYFVRGGEQLSPTGRTECAERLAAVLEAAAGS